MLDGLRLLVVGNEEAAKVMSGKSNLEKADQVWSFIVKYSMTANAAALTLTLAAYGKDPALQTGLSIGKAPIWCFFLGILLSGSHLIMSFFFYLESQKQIISDELDAQKNEVGEIRERALDLGVFDKEVVRLTDETRRARDALELARASDGEVALKILRALQEYLLWASYSCFFIGLTLVITHI